MSGRAVELVAQARYEARVQSARVAGEFDAGRIALDHVLLGGTAHDVVARAGSGVSYRSETGSTPAGPARRSLTVRELLALDGEDFARNAYREILDRDAEPEALRSLSEALHRGANKLDLLRDMANSEEARKSGRHVAGLRMHSLAERIYRIPLLGYLAQVAVGVSRIPRILRDQETQRHLLRAENARLSARVEELAIEVERHRDRLAPLSDHFVEELERSFRGDREDICARLEAYVRFLPTGSNLSGNALDLGAGRCEWMSVASEHGFVVKGVDSNPLFARGAKALGLEVEHADALEYLKNLGSRTQSLVTAFHVVEHLQVKVMLEWLSESYRVLEPGGRLFLETPNPKNLIVGSCNFYLDPTHVSPLPPELLRFSLEYVGFDEVRVVELHPWMDGTTRSEEQELDRQLAGWVFGPQDYGVIATKGE